MKSLRRIFLFAICFLATVALVSCGGTGSTADVVTETEAEEIVASIKDHVALTEGLVVENDITLKTSYEDAPDAIIAWKTSNAAFITAEGLVTRPEYAVGDKTVTLSVTITVPYNQNAAGETYYGRVQKTYNFEVTVKAMPYVPTDADIANGYLAEVADLSGEYTSNITLPAVTSGEWSISGDLAIVDGVVVVEQTEAVQAATLTVTVTVGAAVVSKSFNITVPALEIVSYETLHYYNSENWANVYVYEWVSGSDGVVAWPGTKVEVVDGWAHYELSHAAAGYNYIFNDGVNNSGKQTPDIAYAGNDYFYGVCGQSFATAEEAVAHHAANKTVVYVRGLNGDWGTTTALTEVDGQYTITLELKAGDSFKFATADWSTVNLGATAVKAVDSVNFKGSDNIEVVNAGTYTFTISKTAVVSIVKHVNEAEEAQKIMDTITVDGTCAGTLALQQAEGLTWSVKEGTAIVITDGVAFVTQSDVEQHVVLTATVVYGEAVVTKDFAVTVLALEPTDEEIAHGYLTSVEDLSGEYTANLVLPAVTAGVWSAEGAEIVDGALVIAQTEEVQNIVLTLTVTVGEYVGTRTFAITVPAMEVVVYPTLHYYNSDNWANVYVYEWTVDPRVAWPGTKLEVVDGWVHYELSYNPTGYNYIFNDGSSKQTSDMVYNGNTYFYGTVGQAFATEEEMMAHYNANKLVVYIRGTLNGWGTSNPLTDLGDGTYTITVDLAADAQFKFATEDWSTVNIAGSTIANADKVNFKAEGDNAVVVTEGTYKFVITKTSVVSIERIIDEAAEAQKVMDTVVLHDNCQDSLELPTAEGLTWAVKEGTAIVITDGVAVVTQGEADQVVVLTATVVYGEAVVTKDFTVTVLALTISDEDLAAAYLAEVADLSGSYKTNITLPSVTNGVWSVSGDGVALSGNTVTVTRAEADQTAVLTITVTVNEVVLSRDFEITIPLAYFVYYYNTKSWSKVNIYYWQTGSDGVVGWPGAAMTKSTSNTKVYYYASDTPFTGYNIIFNNGSSQTGDIVYSGTYYYGECNKGFDTLEAAMAHYEANKNITPIYIRGSMNNWGTSTALEYDSDTQQYSITIALSANAEFKFADSGWSSVNLGWAAIKSIDSTNFSQSGENIKCKVAGTYTFVIQNKKIISVTKA